MVSEIRTRIGVIALFTVLGYGLYANVVLNGVFLFDDYVYIVDNGAIQTRIPWDLADPRWMGYLTFALNFSMGGKDPFGYHLVNVVIHILNAIIVFFLLRLMLRVLADRLPDREREEQDGIAFIAGLLFLVHPAGTMAVSYLSQRFTSLATLFYLLSVHAYLAARLRIETGRRDRAFSVRYALSLTCALVAMLTKEISFTLPFCLAVLELLLFKNSVAGRGRFLFLAPFLLLLAVIPLLLFGPEIGLFATTTSIAETTRTGKLLDLTMRSPYEYLLTQFRVIVIYLRLLLFPVGQCAYYDLKVSRSLFEPRVILSMVILASIIAAAVLVWRRSAGMKPSDAALRKFAALGILWFFLTLSVESSVIPIKDLIFEHRIYLPSVGFFAALSVALFSLFKWTRMSAGPLVRVAVLAPVLVAVFGTATVLRNRVWTDELLFWNDVIDKNPNKAIAYFERGKAFVKAGRYGDALEDMDRAIAGFPKNPLAAMTSFEIADLTAGTLAEIYLNRATIHHRLGKEDLARKDMVHAQEIVSRRPVDTDRARILAEEYARRGWHRESIEEYSRILEWDPADNGARMDRAGSYYSLGKYQEAVRDLTVIVRSAPDPSPAFHNRGIAYAASGDRKRAMADFRQACSRGFKPSCDSMNALGRRTP